jgi:hypothetical protein
VKGEEIGAYSVRVWGLGFGAKGLGSSGSGLSGVWSLGFRV